ncbi:MAG: 3-methyl-2-oxobutanoate hydroxymethyltransferase [Thermoanaerobaculia bacterium]
MSQSQDRITVPRVAGAPERGEKLVVITAYDYRQGRLADEAGVDVVLVGDSLAMVVLGHDDTLSVTVDEMLHHVKAVRRGVERALLVADMPYGSFHLGERDTVANGLRFVREGGAQAVKIEGPRTAEVAALVEAEIPVMAHLGLTPQSVHKMGGYKVQGRGEEARRRLLADAAAAPGRRRLRPRARSSVPSELAGKSEALTIPTIGIGAGPACDGQVLVYHDLLGLEDRLSPKFVRRYADLGAAAGEAIQRYAGDVRAGRFPSAEESFDDPGRAASNVHQIYG